MNSVNDFKAPKTLKYYDSTDLLKFKKIYSPALLVKLRNWTCRCRCPALEDPLCRATTVDVRHSFPKEGAFSSTNYQS